MNFPTESWGPHPSSDSGCVQTDATLLTNISHYCWLLHVASVCTPCCMLLDVVAQSLKPVKLWQPTTPNISFVPWSPKRSSTTLDPFAQLFQHCWGRARSLRMAYKDLWVVSFHPFAHHCQHARKTPNIVGSTMLGVVESVCTQRQRRNWICPCVYVLQTTAEKEIYDRVRTGCKEKRTGPAKCCFSFTYWAHCRHRRLRRCSQDLSMCVNGQESEHVFGKNACHLFTRYICYSRFGPFFVSLETEISVLWKKKTLFLWKPKFGWRGKKSPLF